MESETLARKKGPPPNRSRKGGVKDYLWSWDVRLRRHAVPHPPVASSSVRERLGGPPGPTSGSGPPPFPGP